MDFTPNQCINNLNLELDDSPHVEEFSNDDLAEQLNMFSNPYFFDFEPVNLFPHNFYGSLPQNVNPNSSAAQAKYKTQPQHAVPSSQFTTSSNVPVSAIPKQEPLENPEVSAKLPQEDNQNPYLTTENLNLLNATRVMQMPGKNSPGLFPLSNTTQFLESKASQNQQKIPTPPSFAYKRPSDSSLDLSSSSVGSNAGKEDTITSATTNKRTSTSARLPDLQQYDATNEHELASVPSTPVGVSAPLNKRPKTDSSDAAIRNAAEEDKRRRNTAASARFRIKKKQKEQQLERTANELSEKVISLESRIGELEMENNWLKGLIRPATNF